MVVRFRPHRQALVLRGAGGKRDSNNKAGKRLIRCEGSALRQWQELGQPVVLNEANGWSHKWPGLILQENDADIYSVGTGCS